MKLILDKIMFSGAQPLVARARLLAKLRESLNCCVASVITGRAGTGKSLLAADFARASGRRVAWYKVDAPESDFGLFLKYFTESVTVARPGFGQRTLALSGAARHATDFPHLAESFVYELMESAGQPLLMVVDDLHLVYDAEWVVPFFQRLLPLLPADAHLLVTGRGLPPAPLWRMRSKQTLCVIDETELAFTLAEAQALWRAYGLPGAQEAGAALTRTRGRAALLDALAQELRAQEQAAAELLAPRERRPELRLVRG